MDVEMPGGDGITATHRVTATLPDVRVLILTMFDLDDYVLTALRAGASGFLLKTTAPHALIGSVKEAAAGGMTLGPRLGPTRRQLRRPPRSSGSSSGRGRSH